MEIDINVLLKELRGCPGSGTTEKMGEVIEGIRCQHRTHQANIVRNLVAILDGLKELPTDPRNEGAINACKDISGLDVYIPYI